MGVVCVKHPQSESRASRLTFDPAWWQAQLANLSRWFTPGGGQPCKESHSGLVTRVALAHPEGALQVIAKRPQARNGWRRIIQWLPPSRSRRGWRIGHALLHRDIPTARPLAILERRFGPCAPDSVLLTEALPGALDLETYLHEKHLALPRDEWLRLKREFSTQLVRHVRRLFDCGFAHRDCKASNILVVQHPERKLLWIDMDGIRRRRFGRPADPLRALTWLHVSLLRVPGLTRTDRLRFLQAYAARFGAPHDAWRRLWRAIDARSTVKRQAKEARRQWKLKHYGRE
jgi:hypothetical protein